jgi:hypothetical protein
MLLTLTGTTPLLMHNVQLADSANQIVKQIAAITSKKSNKTEADETEISRLKFIGGMYYDQVAGPYLPGTNIFKSLIEAARKTRDGKNVEMGLFLLADKAPLQYVGPRNLDEMWGDGTTRFVDRRMVTVNRGRVPGVRPIFPEWRAQIAVDYDPEVIDRDNLESICVRAGVGVGIGDFRRIYGRYVAKLED